MGWSHSPLALCSMQVTQGAELQEKAREVEALQVCELTVPQITVGSAPGTNLAEEQILRHSLHCKPLSPMVCVQKFKLVPRTHAY